jgi:hypothetical protein
MRGRVPALCNLRISAKSGGPIRMGVVRRPPTIGISPQFLMYVSAWRRPHDPELFLARQTQIGKCHLEVVRWLGSRYQHMRGLQL